MCLLDLFCVRNIFSVLVLFGYFFILELSYINKRKRIALGNLYLFFFSMIVLVVKVLIEVERLVVICGRCVLL